MPLKKRASIPKKIPKPTRRTGTILANPDRKITGTSQSNQDPDRPLSDQEWTMLKHYASMESPSLYQAYKLAGYTGIGQSGMVAASIIFSTPAFQKQLELEVNARKQLMRVEINSVIRNLILLANANMDDYATWKGGRVILKDSTALTRDQKYAIVEVKDTAQGVQIKLDSRQNALTMLATHLGFLVPDPSKTKDVRETAQQIKEEADKLFNSVPTEPPTTPSPSSEGGSE